MLISNIKLPILKKEEYDIWAMEMKHYLEYIDWGKYGSNSEGNSRNEFQLEIEHMRRFHGMDDAKEIWEAIRTRFGGNANSKKMQKAVFKQHINSRMRIHSLLESLPPAWSNLAMTMRTNPEIDTLSIDDLYNNLRVFEQEIQGASKTSSSAQNSCTPSTSSTNVPEKEVLAGFADEGHQLDWQIAMIAIRMKKFYKKTGRRVRVDGKTPVGFDKKKLECFNCHNTGHFARECTAKGTHDGKKKRDSLYQHQEAGKQEKNQMGLLTMDDGIVNWGEHTEAEETNHALMAISSSNEVTLCSKTCIDSYNSLKTLCDEQMNQLGDQEAQILAYSQAVKKLEAQLVTSQKQQLSLNEKLAFQANEIHEKDEKLKRYRRIGMKAVKEKEQLQKTVDSWKDSSKNLWRLINSGMSSNDKLGLGFEIQSNDEVLSYEEEMNFSVFKCSKEDSIGKPSYSRFTKTNDFKGVPPPLSGDYTPKPQEEIDDSLYVYGKKGPQKPEISVSDENSSEHSTCQSNDSEGSCENTSEHSFETESESLDEPNEMSKSRLEVTNEKDVSAPKSKEVEPSCVSHIKTPRQPLKDKEAHKVNRKNWNDMMERELGEGYSFTKKKCFVCGSLNHLIKDCDYYEKKMAREAEVKRVVNTGNRVAKPVWTNANRINHSNKFVPRSVQLNAGRPKFNSVRPNINTGRTNISSGRPKVNTVSPKVNTGLIDWRNKDHTGGFLKNSMAGLLPLELPVSKGLILALKILLKVPRHHNMYSFDMKTPSPAKGFACLIAKATSDESKLWHRRFSWVFFLASKDETSGILQTFIRQIENQLSHRVKIIRSDNGTEFKKLALKYGPCGPTSTTEAEYVAALQIAVDKYCELHPQPSSSTPQSNPPHIVLQHCYCTATPITYYYTTTYPYIYTYTPPISTPNTYTPPPIPTLHSYTNNLHDTDNPTHLSITYEESSPSPPNFSPPQDQAPTWRMDLKANQADHGKCPIVKLVKESKVVGRVCVKRRNLRFCQTLKRGRTEILANEQILRMLVLRSLLSDQDKGHTLGEGKALILLLISERTSKERRPKQVLLDSLPGAQRIAEEEELNEQQKKRKAQTKTPKRLKDDKDDEAKDDEPTKKSGRRKQMARKGMHTSVDKNDSEDSDDVGEQEESTTLVIGIHCVRLRSPWEVYMSGMKGTRYPLLLETLAIEIEKDNHLVERCPIALTQQMVHQFTMFSTKSTYRTGYLFGPLVARVSLATATLGVMIGVFVHCADKSPCPDGFTFGFYRRFWKIIENDVYDAVKYFFTYGNIPKGFNSSFIALIPKIPDANMVKYFRPICLIGSLYKIIAKILANRLVGVLGDIVNEVQSAFIAERQILDGPFILNEILQWSKTKKKQSLIFKVDFEKAYDSVRWDFLDDILKSLDLAKNDVSGFKAALDLRELSSSLSISHLFYADDAVFMGQWCDGNISTLIHVLECFYRASGLRINMSKSKILGVNVDSDKVKGAASKLGCLILKTPFTYLGSKVGGSMSRVHAWNEVIDRVKNRLSKWKMKTLSIGGRLTLLKSVLGSIPIFHMSIYRAPLSVLRTLESIRSKFFKGHDINSNKASWVNWKKVLASKEKGGLGVSSLFALNRGLMFKWIWRFYTQNTLLWVRVVKAIHGDDGNVGGHVKSGAKSCWLDIVRETHALKTKGINLLDCMHVKLGNGDKTIFWEDIWIDGKTLKNRFPRIYSLESCKLITVGAKLAQPSLEYSFRRNPRGGVEQDQFNELSALVHDVSLIPMSDRWKWDLESSGDFSVASVRKIIDDKSLSDVDSKTRWIKYVPIKVNVHAWKVKTDSLPTRFNVSRRGIDIDSIMCAICDNGVETSRHLFFYCCMVKQIVRKITRWWDVPYVEVESYEDWYNWLVNLRISSMHKQMFEGIDVMRRLVVTQDPMRIQNKRNLNGFQLHNLPPSPSSLSTRS
ncbi:RNA-directed DNA polymerase, eukaryota, reverse transcriptase zinc-binding domain protein [Tanacetum coccineum]